jgi:hypothetical protein
MKTIKIRLFNDRAYFTPRILVIQIKKTKRETGRKAASLNLATTAGKFCRRELI